MKGRIQMTFEAQRRAKYLEMILQKKMTQTEASKILKLSRRQVIRLFKRYKNDGDESLNHGLIGKAGNHKTAKELREKVIELYKEKYMRFGPTLAAEKMEENDNIKIKAETLRNILKKEGLWEKKRKSRSHRKRRERKEGFGEMVQIDGSMHDWFQNGNKNICLMNMIDDATGISCGLFDTGETTDVALRSLYCWIKKYGIPQSLYSDYKKVFYTDKEPCLEEQLKGNDKCYTKLGYVCKELGIEMIYASSPQAKGRVERANGIHQDRLVKEMGLSGIKNIGDGNRFLEEYYWEKHNKKFGKKPSSDIDYHINLFDSQNLDDIVCYYYTRKLSRDFVIKLENRMFQIRKVQEITVIPGNILTVKKWLDGSIHIHKNNIELSYYEIDNYGRKVIA